MKIKVASIVVIENTVFFKIFLNSFIPFFGTASSA